jgi:hypothetical protein
MDPFGAYRFDHALSAFLSGERENRDLSGLFDHHIKTIKKLNTLLLCKR